MYKILDKAPKICYNNGLKRERRRQDGSHSFDDRTHQPSDRHFCFASVG